MKKYVALSIVLSGLPAIALGNQSPDHDKKADQCFALKVDDDFNRPLIRFSPPKDDNGQRPHDVIKSFLSHVQNNDFDAAPKLVLLEPYQTGPTKVTSIGSKRLKVGCKRFRVFMENGSVVLSSSAINSKEDYWTIRYIATTAKGVKYNRAFVLQRHSGVWLICEKGTWTEWTKETNDPANSKRASVPLW